MSDLIAGKKLDYYTTGPDLFINSNRNGIVTLTSREFVNLQRHQHIVEDATDNGYKPKLSTMASSWLKSEKEKASLEEEDRLKKISKLKELESIRRELASSSSRDTNKRSQSVNSTHQSIQHSRSKVKTKPNNDDNEDSIDYDDLLGSKKKFKTPEEQLRDDERLKRLEKGKICLQESREKRRREMASIKRKEEDARKQKAERLSDLQEKSRMLARKPSPQQARLKLAQSRGLAVSGTFKFNSLDDDDDDENDVNKKPVKTQDELKKEEEHKRRLEEGKQFLEIQREKRKKLMHQMKVTSNEAKKVLEERLHKLDEERRQLARKPSPIDARLRLSASRALYNSSLDNFESILIAPPSPKSHLKTLRSGLDPNKENDSIYSFNNERLINGDNDNDYSYNIDNQNVEFPVAPTFTHDTATTETITLTGSFINQYLNNSHNKVNSYVKQNSLSNKYTSSVTEKTPITVIQRKNSNPYIDGHTNLQKDRMTQSRPSSTPTNIRRNSINSNSSSRSVSNPRNLPQTQFQRSVSAELNRSRNGSHHQRQRASPSSTSHVDRPTVYQSRHATPTPIQSHHKSIVDESQYKEPLNTPLTYSNPVAKSSSSSVYDTTNTSIKPAIPSQQKSTTNSKQRSSSSHKKLTRRQASQNTKMTDMNRNLLDLMTKSDTLYDGQHIIHQFDHSRQNNNNNNNNKSNRHGDDVYSPLPHSQGLVDSTLDNSMSVIDLVNKNFENVQRMLNEIETMTSSLKIKAQVLEAQVSIPIRDSLVFATEPTSTSTSSSIYGGDIVDTVHFKQLSDQSYLSKSNNYDNNNNNNNNSNINSNRTINSSHGYSQNQLTSHKRHSSPSSSSSSSSSSSTQKIQPLRNSMDFTTNHSSYVNDEENDDVLIQADEIIDSIAAIHALSNQHRSSSINTKTLMTSETNTTVDLNILSPNTNTRSNSNNDYQIITDKNQYLGIHSSDPTVTVTQEKVGLSLTDHRLGLLQDKHDILAKYGDINVNSFPMVSANKNNTVSNDFSKKHEELSQSVLDVFRPKSNAKTNNSSSSLSTSKQHPHSHQSIHNDHTSHPNSASNNESNSTNERLSLRNIGELAGLLNARNLDYPPLNKDNDDDDIDVNVYPVQSNDQTYDPQLFDKQLNMKSMLDKHSMHHRIGTLLHTFDSSSNDQNDDSDEDSERDKHNIVTIIAKDILKNEQEKQKRLKLLDDAIAKEKSVVQQYQDEHEQRLREIEKQKVKELEAYEQSVIEEINRSNERMNHLVMLHDEANLDDNRNHSKVTDPNVDESISYWDSLLKMPLPSSDQVGRSNQQQPRLNLTPQDIQQLKQTLGLSESVTINTNIADGSIVNSVYKSHTPTSATSIHQINGTTVSKQTPMRPSAAQFKNRLADELKKQDQIFKYTLELSEIEQTHTLRLAKDTVQQIADQARYENDALRRSQHDLEKVVASNNNIQTTTISIQPISEHSNASSTILSKPTVASSIKFTEQKSSSPLQQSSDTVGSKSNPVSVVKNLSKPRGKSKEQLQQSYDDSSQSYSMSFDGSTDDYPNSSKSQISPRSTRMISPRNVNNRHNSMSTVPESYEDDFTESHSHSIETINDNILENHSHSSTYVVEDVIDAASQSQSREYDQSQSQSQSIPEENDNSAAQSSSASIQSVISEHYSKSGSVSGDRSIRTAQDEDNDEDIDESEAMEAYSTNFETSGIDGYSTNFEAVSSNAMFSPVWNKKATNDINNRKKPSTEHINIKVDKKVSPVSHQQVTDDASVGAVRRSIESLSKNALPSSEATSNLINLKDSMNSDVESNSKPKHEAIKALAEYRHEMEQRVKSQQKGLELRAQLLQNKRNQQHHVLDEKKNLQILLNNKNTKVSDTEKKKLLDAIDSEIQYINEAYSEAQAELERDRWAMSARAYKELRQYKRMKLDIEKYGLSSSTIAELSPATHRTANVFNFSSLKEEDEYDDDDEYEEMEGSSSISHGYGNSHNQNKVNESVTSKMMQQSSSNRSIVTAISVNSPRSHTSNVSDMAIESQIDITAFSVQSEHTIHTEASPAISIEASDHSKPASSVDYSIQFEVMEDSTTSKERSEDTLEELENSIKIRKNRIESLKRNVKELKDERSRHELKRAMMFEKQDLIQTETRLLKEIDREMSILQQEELGIQKATIAIKNADINLLRASKTSDISVHEKNISDYEEDDKVLLNNDDEEEDAYEEEYSNNFVKNSSSEAIEEDIPDDTATSGRYRRNSNYSQDDYDDEVEEDILEEVNENNDDTNHSLQEEIIVEESIALLGPADTSVVLSSRAPVLRRQLTKGTASAASDYENESESMLYESAFESFEISNLRPPLGRNNVSMDRSHSAIIEEEENIAAADTSMAADDDVEYSTDFNGESIIMTKSSRKSPRAVLVEESVNYDDDFVSSSNVNISKDQVESNKQVDDEPLEDIEEELPEEISESYSASFDRDSDASKSKQSSPRKSPRKSPRESESLLSQEQSKLHTLPEESVNYDDDFVSSSNVNISKDQVESNKQVDDEPLEDIEEELPEEISESYSASFDRDSDASKSKQSSPRKSPRKSPRESESLLSKEQSKLHTLPEESVNYDDDFVSSSNVNISKDQVESNKQVDDEPLEDIEEELPEEISESYSASFDRDSDASKSKQSSPRKSPRKSPRESESLLSKEQSKLHTLPEESVNYDDDFVSSSNVNISKDQVESNKQVDDEPLEDIEEELPEEISASASQSSFEQSSNSSKSKQSENAFDLNDSPRKSARETEASEEKDSVTTSTKVDPFEAEQSSDKPDESVNNSYDYDFVSSSNVNISKDQVESNKQTDDEPLDDIEEELPEEISASASQSSFEQSSNSSKSKQSENAFDLNDSPRKSARETEASEEKDSVTTSTKVDPFEAEQNSDKPDESVNNSYDDDFVSSSNVNISKDQVESNKQTDDEPLDDIEEELPEEISESASQSSFEQSSNSSKSKQSENAFDLNDSPRKLSTNDVLEDLEESLNEFNQSVDEMILPSPRKFSPRTSPRSEPSIDSPKLQKKLSVLNEEGKANDSFESESDVSKDDNSVEIIKAKNEVVEIELNKSNNISGEDTDKDNNVTTMTAEKGRDNLSEENTSVYDSSKSKQSENAFDLNDSPRKSARDLDTNVSDSSSFHPKSSRTDDNSHSSRIPRFSSPTSSPRKDNTSPTAASLRSDRDSTPSRIPRLSPRANINILSLSTDNPSKLGGQSVDGQDKIVNEKDELNKVTGDIYEADNSVSKDQIESNNQTDDEPLDDIEEELPEEISASASQSSFEQSSNSSKSKQSENAFDLNDSPRKSARDIDDTSVSDNASFHPKTSSTDDSSHSSRIPRFSSPTSSPRKDNTSPTAASLRSDRDSTPSRIPRLSPRANINILSLSTDNPSKLDIKDVSNENIEEELPEDISFEQGNVSFVSRQSESTVDLKISPRRSVKDEPNIISTPSFDQESMSSSNQFDLKSSPPESIKDHDSSESFAKSSVVDDYEDDFATSVDIVEVVSSRDVLRQMAQPDPCEESEAFFNEDLMVYTSSKVILDESVDSQSKPIIHEKLLEEFEESLDEFQQSVSAMVLPSPRRLDSTVTPRGDASSPRSFDFRSSPRTNSEASGTPRTANTFPSETVDLKNDTLEVEEEDRIEEELLEEIEEASSHDSSRSSNAFDLGDSPRSKSTTASSKSKSSHKSVSPESSSKSSFSAVESKSSSDKQVESKIESKVESEIEEPVFKPSPMKKKAAFKAPDGTEFDTKAEWRDYMMVTYYSFKDKHNESEPLVKKSGDVDGQSFDIADCSDSTMVVMDHSEQVQIDEVHNSRVFIGACASAIFIRNCTKCVFYTCCRQLRLRDVVDCTLYVYSTSEVHIEDSHAVKFAPFNGSYPDHASHLRQANLDPSTNLWYDIYDHSDPDRKSNNWCLLDESEHESAWYPDGDSCEFAIPKTKAGFVEKQVDENMQSFSVRPPAIASTTVVESSVKLSETKDDEDDYDKDFEEEDQIEEELLEEIEEASSHDSSRSSNAFDLGDSPRSKSTTASSKSKSSHKSVSSESSSKSSFSAVEFKSSSDKQVESKNESKVESEIEEPVFKPSPVKKKAAFKAPDGTEFDSKAEWRDYMMVTYYSFKDKHNASEPLVKKSGDVDGQSFDITDCSDSTMVVMDHSEQVQIDEVHNSRVFIGACTSAIFIRNCTKCVFYTCCRQLRLRDVVDCTLYVYSTSEVHIEDSHAVKFAPFNGSYSDHASHLRQANLDPSTNLWYDIYDHSDPDIKSNNWCLLDESEHESAWYPDGDSCEFAIPKTKAGSVEKQVDENMQSFSVRPPAIVSTTVVESSVKLSETKEDEDDYDKDFEEEDRIEEELLEEIEETSSHDSSRSSNAFDLGDSPHSKSTTASSKSKSSSKSVSPESSSKSSFSAVESKSSSDKQVEPKNESKVESEIEEPVFKPSPVKKKAAFKAPDGTEFDSKAEWRDYMMVTYYSFKDKHNASEPLVKKSGDVDGQSFDIADCSDSTMVVMDHSEQVQIDEVHNSRVFIGACASAIFIRNCTKCVFYTCCRQLRLRDVVDCTLYVYSTSEVHIEDSHAVKFAPFNGSYPDHASHLRQANLDPSTNLWYDIYDHSDPDRKSNNWRLLDESEHESAWYPDGDSCEFAIPKTKAGSVEKQVDENMQSFSVRPPAIASTTVVESSVKLSETKDDEDDYDKDFEEEDQIEEELLEEIEEASSHDSSRSSNAFDLGDSPRSKSTTASSKSKSSSKSVSPESSSKSSFSAVESKSSSDKQVEPKNESKVESEIEEPVFKPSPVKKKAAFKAPDGTEFDSKAEWRDYMMVTYYSFKDKHNASEPLVKKSGDVDGQSFDIADCSDSTMVVMDHSEQVQIDEVHNSRVFIGACTSAIFIRNCTKCVFYTCCRQLRLRDVVDCTLYVYSTSEVHIEDSHAVKFAPFNGSYPDHASHLRQANLDPSTNLWYDIYDHSDPDRKSNNWCLLDESEHESAWYPDGDSCEFAIPKTKAGSVEKQVDENMQSFSVHPPAIASTTVVEDAKSSVKLSETKEDEDDYDKDFEEEDQIEEELLEEIEETSSHDSSRSSNAFDLGDSPRSKSTTASSKSKSSSKSVSPESSSKSSFSAVESKSSSSDKQVESKIESKVESEIEEPVFKPSPMKKKAAFKAPDGTEFDSKAEWRDYMMVTYYSFKDKHNESEPFVKKSGDVDGQSFDIADCSDSTMVVMDHSEQVQIDEVHNSRVFIGACASAIFIRNCTKCVFYTCCRQLRLRDVVDCTLYVYSTSEVHIEDSHAVKFAPFNGSYPDHASHLRQANLDPSTNLWYDIYDHSDPDRKSNNWRLLDESEHESAWYPDGDSCEFAIPKTKAGSVEKQVDENMQSFSVHPPAIASTTVVEGVKSSVKLSETKEDEDDYDKDFEEEDQIEEELLEEIEEASSHDSSRSSNAFDLGDSPHSKSTTASSKSKSSNKSVSSESSSKSSFSAVESKSSSDKQVESKNESEPKIIFFKQSSSIQNIRDNKVDLDDNVDYENIEKNFEEESLEVEEIGEGESFEELESIHDSSDSSNKFNLRDSSESKNDKDIDDNKSTSLYNPSIPRLSQSRSNQLDSDVISSPPKTSQKDFPSRLNEMDLNKDKWNNKKLDELSNPSVHDVEDRHTDMLSPMNKFDLKDHDMNKFDKDSSRDVSVSSIGDQTVSRDHSPLIEGGGKSPHPLRDFSPESKDTTLPWKKDNDKKEIYGYPAHSPPSHQKSSHVNRSLIAADNDDGDNDDEILLEIPKSGKIQINKNDDSLEILNDINNNDINDSNISSEIKSNDKITIRKPRGRQSYKKSNIHSDFDYDEDLSKDEFNEYEEFKSEKKDNLISPSVFIKSSSSSSSSSSIHNNKEIESGNESSSDEIKSIDDDSQISASKQKHISEKKPIPPISMQNISPSSASPSSNISPRRKSSNKDSLEDSLSGSLDDSLYDFDSTLSPRKYHSNKYETHNIKSPDKKSPSQLSPSAVSHSVSSPQKNNSTPTVATTTTIAKENSTTSNWNSPKSPVKTKSAKTVPLMPTVLEDLTTTYFENLKFNTIIENLNNPDFKGPFVSKIEREKSSKNSNKSISDDTKESHLIKEFEETVQERVDEILTEIHQDRFKYKNHMYNGKVKNVCLLPSTFSKRLVAENLPMTPELIQKEVIRRLKQDQARMLEVSEGKKHVLETVHVNTLEEYYDAVNQRVVELLNKDEHRK